MTSTDEPRIEGMNTAEMRNYLARTAVVFAVLFGSHARNAADASSDVDIALCFPEEMDDHERFHLRNRIDAELQQYVEGFADVSDIGALPTAVAYAALRDGILITGNEQVVDAYRGRVEKEYEATADEREQERREFIDRLAKGDV